jgi:hypothetical protein
MKRQSHRLRENIYMLTRGSVFKTQGKENKQNNLKMAKDWNNISSKKIYKSQITDHVSLGKSKLEQQ